MSASPLRRVPDRWWVPAVASLALALVFVAALLVRADGDPSILVHAAPPWTDASQARGSLTVQPSEEDAFDGQFFYRLGVDPTSTDETVAGVTFDLPSLRNARWGYGALAWVASAGDPDLVPWALIAVNLAAAFAVGAAGGALARTSGRHAAWGLAFALWPGFAYSLSLDTSELVAGAFVLGGLLAARRLRWPLAALALTAAVLTRDTTAVVAFGFAVAGGWTLVRDRRPTGPLLVGAVPLAAFAGWQLLQRARFGALPLTSSGDNNLSAPFGGLVDNLRDLLPPDGGEAAFRLLFCVGLLALIALGAWCWPSSTAPLSERLGWVAAAGVVVLLNAYLWSGATAFMRASTEVGLLTTALVLATDRAWARRLLAAGLAAGWVLTAIAQLSKLG
ncbi:MAG: hypothetical protein KF906_02740 [Actinobacteria bacterium]|nr:hypothetical protein [Actinomycetota bacterium]